MLLLPKHRYGIIGKNGSGKTSLMRKIFKKQIQGFPMHISTSLCEQEVEGSEKTVLETIMYSDPELELLKKAELKIQRDLEENKISLKQSEESLREIYVKLEMKQIHLLETKAKKLLKGFGFMNRMLNVPTLNLSGGLRQKLALTQALFQNADVLCLDEPTNHLDIENKLFLVNYLKKNYKGTLVVVSHDTSFLNSICTDIIELRKKTLEYFPGSYRDFEIIKEDREKFRRERYEKQQRKINQAKEKMEKVVNQSLKKAKSKKKKILKRVLKELNNINLKLIELFMLDMKMGVDIENHMMVQDI